MSLYKITNQTLTSVKEKKIDLEKDLQTLTEDNLETLFGYTKVCTEFRIDTFRFDTLAWDSENKAFIIIEYKKDRNFSVVDQGFAYLSVLLNRKADFILEYNTKFPNKQLRKEDIDWSQSRVVFVAPYFTPYQINSINFKNMAFDLYEVKMYDNDTIAYNKIEASNPSESINLVTNGGKIETVSKEIKNYSIEDHFKANWTEGRALFDIMNERILELDPNIVCVPKKIYIGYKIGTTVIFNLVAYKTSLLFELYRVKPEDLNDPEDRTTYQKNSFEYYSKHVTHFKIEKEEDIDYAIMLAKQVYRKFIDSK